MHMIQWVTVVVQKYWMSSCKNGNNEIVTCQEDQKGPSA